MVFVKMATMKKLVLGLSLLLLCGCGSVGAKVTKAEFDQVQSGMTYSQVAAIIGDPGEKISESDMAGFHTVMYMWRNPTGANMNAMFQNDKMINKAQINLP
jgi:outer membrane protein assembly factor BamE (lipoprotein component of BamABCDE complex)